MKLQKTYQIVLVVIVSFTLGFYGGGVYQDSNTSAGMTEQSERQMRFQGGANGSPRGMSRSPLLTGEVIAKDDTSLTLKLRDGGSKIVFYSPKTTTTKTATTSVNEIVLGAIISVNGNANTDGSLTANAIQLNPLFLEMRANFDSTTAR